MKTFDVDRGYLDYLSLRNNKADRYEIWRRRIIKRAYARHPIVSFKAWHKAQSTEMVTS